MHITLYTSVNNLANRFCIDLVSKKLLFKGFSMIACMYKSKKTKLSSFSFLPQTLTSTDGWDQFKPEMFTYLRALLLPSASEP